MKNFLPLDRDINKHWIFKDNDYLKVWLTMLLSARYSKEQKTDVYKGVLYTIRYSEFLFSRLTFSEKCNITDSKLRTLLKLLKNNSMIEEVKSLGKNKPTIYKIINYEMYNTSPSEVIVNSGLEVDIDQVDTQSSPSGHPVVSKSSPLKKIDNIEREKENNYIVFFEEAWQLYPEKKGKGKISDSKKKELYKLGDELKRCIERYRKDTDKRRKTFKDLKYQNGSTFFTTGYIDYLDTKEPKTEQPIDLEIIYVER